MESGANGRGGGKIGCGGGVIKSARGQHVNTSNMQMEKHNMDIKKALKDLEGAISQTTSLDDLFLENQQFKNALSCAKNAVDKSIKQGPISLDDSYEMQDIVDTLGDIENKYKKCRFPETKKDFLGPFERVRRRLSRLNQKLNVTQ